MKCSVPSCPAARYGLKDWCRKHCRRVLIHGTPKLPTAEDRFWTKVDKQGTWCQRYQSHCWDWIASKTEGYGSFSVSGRRVLAHRFSYELVHGSIPAGFMIDHGCHNTGCVNPEHLRLATPKQSSENRNGASSISKSGIRGVVKVPGYDRWRAQVEHQGHNLYLGIFPSPAEAEAVVIAKRNELFTFNIVDRQEVS